MFLDLLTLLHFHRHIDINMGEVIDEFARCLPWRLQLTNIVDDSIFCFFIRSQFGQLWFLCLWPPSCALMYLNYIHKPQSSNISGRGFGFQFWAPFSRILATPLSHAYSVATFCALSCLVSLYFLLTLYTSFCLLSLYSFFLVLCYFSWTLSFLLHC